MKSSKKLMILQLRIIKDQNIKKLLKNYNYKTLLNSKKISLSIFSARKL